MSSQEDPNLESLLFLSADMTHPKAWAPVLNDIHTDKNKP